MNKYEEALDELSFPLDDSSCGGCKCGTSDCQDCKKAQAVFKLQELVEKATPKKPIKEENGKGITRYFCPNCSEMYECHWKDEIRNEAPYCYLCGQAIDWSEEDE